MCLCGVWCVCELGVVISDIDDDRKNFCIALCLTFPLLGRFLLTDFSSLELFIMAEKVGGLILVETRILTGGRSPDKEREGKKACRIFQLGGTIALAAEENPYILQHILSGVIS